MEKLIQKIIAIIVILTDDLSLKEKEEFYKKLKEKIGR